MKPLNENYVHIMCEPRMRSTSSSRDVESFAENIDYLFVLILLRILTMFSSPLILLFILVLYQIVKILLDVK